MSKKYQYLAGLQESTGEIIYSRARHDFIKTTDNQGFIDGGTDYCRHSGVKLIVIESEVSPAVLQDDWDFARDIYGRLNIKDATIVSKENYEDRESFEYEKKYATWGTYGRDGKGPRKTIMLVDAESSHLRAILDTQNHISSETRLVIESILKDRGEN